MSKIPSERLLTPSDIAKVRRIKAMVENQFNALQEYNALNTELRTLEQSLMRFTDERDALATDEEDKASTLNQQIEKLNQAKTTLEDRLSAINEAAELQRELISKYHKEGIEGLKISLDNNGRVKKISKSKSKSDALPFSVIFDENNQAYALYRGKEKLLGAGLFGRVKLTQNIDTGEWFAVKIQDISHLPELGQEIQKENVILREIGLLKGTLTREEDFGGDLKTVEFKTRDEQGVIKTESLEVPKRIKEYAIQKLLSGKSLDAYIQAGSLTPAQMLRLANNILKQIQEFHDKGYLHRDIKLENLIYNPETGEVQLIDFGLSVKAKTHLDKSLGTVDYMAPEIRQKTAMDSELKSYSTKTDIYAVGVLLKKLFANTKVPASTQKTLESLIQKMTLENVEKRPVELTEMRAQLQKILPKEEVASQITTLKAYWEKIARDHKKNQESLNVRRPPQRP